MPGDTEHVFSHEMSPKGQEWGTIGDGTTMNLLCGTISNRNPLLSLRGHLAVEQKLSISCHVVTGAAITHPHSPVINSYTKYMSDNKAGITHPHSAVRNSYICLTNKKDEQTRLAAHNVSSLGVEPFHERKGHPG